MKYSKLTTTALMIILFTGITAASAADLTIFPKESSTEINSFTSYEVEIQNIGEVRDVYSLSSTSKEVDIAPRKVELDPQEGETINVWYNPDTGTDEGRYGFTVTAASRATGERYSIDGTAEVIKDHNIDMTVSESSKTACLGDVAVYTVELKNKGIQPETFELKNTAGSLSESEVSLEEGETREVELGIRSDTPTTESVGVTVSSTTSYATDSKQLRFNAESCYASELTSDKGSEEVPAGTESNIQFTLKNTGTKSDQFEINSNNEIDLEKIDVEAGEERDFNISVNPQELETRQIELTAVSNSESSVTVPVEVYNGMNSEVSLEDQNLNVCEDGEVGTNVTLENTGEAPEQFNLSSSNGELSDQTIELEVGDDESTDLAFNGSNFEEGSQNSFEVSSTASTFGEPVSSAEGQLTVENCWDLNMNVVPRVASAGENRSTIYEIQLENPGTKENTYQLSYEAPSWVNVEPREVTVPAGETKKAFIYAGIPFQKKGEVRITATAKGTQVKETEEVKLLIGKEVDKKDLEESVKDQKDEVDRGPGAVERITGEASRQLDQTGKIVGSIVVGAAVTLGLLFS